MTRCLPEALTWSRLPPAAGNYDTFCKTVAEQEVIQQKKYEKEQEDIKHIKGEPGGQGRRGSGCVSGLQV